MDLITLNAQNQQERLIENYDSLIWTERFNAIGDFQIQTGNVEQFMQLLPEGKVVSLRESNVPMIVERHLIERKKNSPVKLTIKGRDYCSIYDRRVSLLNFAYPPSEWNVVAKIPSDIAHYIMYKITVEGILDPGDIFPASQVQLIAPTDYLTGTGPNRQFNVPRGNLLETVLKFLQVEAEADPTTTPPSPKVEPHGLKAMRPSQAGTAIGVQIYKGTDRSDTVRFEGTRDMLNDGNYLFSKEGSATIGYVLGSNASLKLNRSVQSVPPSGLNRRVLLVDRSGSDISNVDALKNEGVRALSQAHETAIFDGSINEDLSPYTFNVHYGLGDVVNLVGDYGLTTKARVTEYIRSEDATGSKAYPTLSAIREEGLTE